MPDEVRLIVGKIIFTNGLSGEAGNFFADAVEREFDVGGIDARGDAPWRRSEAAFNLAVCIVGKTEFLADGSADAPHHAELPKHAVDEAGSLIVWGEARRTGYAEHEIGLAFAGEADDFAPGSGDRSDGGHGGGFRLAWVLPVFELAANKLDGIRRFDRANDDDDHALRTVVLRVELLQLGK